jgi:hypothetical protein
MARIASPVASPLRRRRSGEEIEEPDDRPDGPWGVHASETTPSASLT